MEKKTEQRAYHGEMVPEDLARALVVRFNEGETLAQWMRAPDAGAVVQVQSRRVERKDPTTAVTVQIAKSPTGVVVTVSDQQRLGLAADLAKTGVKALLNPLELLGEIDDVARNMRWLNLRKEIWGAVDEYCQGRGSGRGVAPHLQRVECEYCGTPNEIGATNCKACGAPLRRGQPVVCGRCGFLNEPRAGRCLNCGAAL